MVRQLILVLSLILFWDSSHAVISELARQGESAIQGLADIKMAPLRYLDVLFGANPGGLRGLDGGIYGAGGPYSALATALQAAQAANILAGNDIMRPGYSKISAGVGQGSDLITIIKNQRPYDPYLIPPGFPGYNFGLGWPRPSSPSSPNSPNSPPGGPGSPGGFGPSRPGNSLPGSPFPGRPFPGGPFSFGPFPGGPFPAGPFPGRPFPGGSLPGRPFPISGGVGGSVGGGGGIFGNGGLLGTGLFGQNGLFGTGFLSGPSLDPFGIFTPFGNLLGGLGNLFGFSASTSTPVVTNPGIPLFGDKFGFLGRGLQGSISLDLGGTLPSPKGILGLLSPLLGVLG
ncbi:ejaculatory bulb-specific protein 1 [Drosophila rhopaloa]|uniref:Ejaculatory bulb-specific protein 1 n=1 Tax=Drosophila rhopaloa TaxID=1041015 RepID=A0A6P4EBK5_DRORH|nr:ejaculatory bulb-specific protein 1 [Drosophila rhopaloa]